MSGSLAVIGGGVIGLSVARRAAQAGWSVQLHRTGDRGASWVAGGMLAPHSEGWPGEERLLRLGLESLRLWREGGFLDGLPPGVVTARESLVVAVDQADVADLRTVADWLSTQGHPVIWSRPPATSNPCWHKGYGTAFGRQPNWQWTTARSSTRCPWTASVEEFDGRPRLTPCRC